MRNLMVVLTATAGVLGMAAPALAIEPIDISLTNRGFTPPFGTVGNTVAFAGTANGTTINVLASGWTATPDGAGGYSFAQSYLSRGLLGLGVTSADELLTNGMFRFDRLDNLDGVDFVLFQFDRDVTILSAILNDTSLLNGVRDNESTVGVGMSSLPWDTQLDLADAAVFDALSIDFHDVARHLESSPAVRPVVPFNLDGLVGNTWMIGANLHNDDTVTIGDTVAPSYDAFNIQKLTLATSAAVPEPASWALMIIGFGAVGMGVRRRSAAGRTVIA